MMKDKNNKDSRKKVLLGMSGGVDSSVSALLLKNEGYEVTGATMKLWSPNEISIDENTPNSAAYDAKKVCQELEIQHKTFDFKEKFLDKVVTPFICDYQNCKTPNPCVWCNKHLKFGELLNKAMILGMDYVATGHYAKVEYSKKYGRYVLKKARNRKKDQSYVLYNIPSNLLGKIIFPLQDFESKDEIRKIAKENNLKVATKPDSEDICFIPDGDYKRFIEKYSDQNSSNVMNGGNIVDINGQILGKHTGLYKYTIGQRKGINVPYKFPLYVIGFNKEKNELVVGEESSLYKTDMVVNNINILLFDDIKSPIKVNVKIRYQAKEEEAIITKIDDDKIKVELLRPVARITPGQAAVFYIDDIVVAGGIIMKDR